MPLMVTRKLRTITCSNASNYDICEHHLLVAMIKGHTSMLMAQQL